VFTKLYHFYDTTCSDRGALNYAKCFRTTNLKGQVVVIMGSRLKIWISNYINIIRFWSKGCRNCKFPTDFAIRFSKEEDYKG